MPNDKLTKIKATVTFDIKAKLPSDLVPTATALGGVHKPASYTANFEFETYFVDDQDKLEAEGNKHALGLATMYKGLMEPHLKLLKGAAAANAKAKAQAEIKKIGSKFSDAPKIVKNQMELHWKKALKPISAARKVELEKSKGASLGLKDKAKQALQVIKVVKNLLGCRKDIAAIKNSIAATVQKTKAAHARYVAIKKNPNLKSELDAAVRNFKLTFAKETAPIPGALKSLLKKVATLLTALQRIYEIAANVDQAALKTAQGFAKAVEVVNKIEGIRKTVVGAIGSFEQHIGFGEKSMKLLIDPAGTVSDEWAKISGTFDDFSPGTSLDSLDPISTLVDQAEQSFKAFVGS